MIEFHLMGSSSNNGESILLRLDNDEIIIVDTFKNLESGEPEPLVLLRDLNINSEDVKKIIITHLHSDHIGGIIDLLKSCPNAEILLPTINYFNSFIGIISISENAISRLYSFIVENNRNVVKVEEGDIICQANNYKLKALYPNTRIIEHYRNEYSIRNKNLLDKIAKKISATKKIKPEAKQSILSSEFNHQSLFLKLESDNINILLAGDLVNHVDPLCGLGYVCKKIISSSKEFNVLKVSHHGSDTGYDKSLNEVLNEKAHLCLTPYQKGNLIPTKEMSELYLSISKFSFITSNPFNIQFFENSKIKREYSKLKGKIHSSPKFSGRIKVFYSVADKVIRSVPTNSACYLNELY